MTIEKRIRICLLIEKMAEHKELSEKLGIRNISTYCGKQMDNMNHV